MVLFKKIAVIGCGKMAGALIDGAVQAGSINARTVKVCSPSLMSGAKLSPYAIGKSNEHTAEAADLIFLGTKPKDIPLVCKQIANVVSPNAVFFSMAAGVPIQVISQALNTDVAIIRGMPNLGCMVGTGVIGCFSNEFVTTEQSVELTSILGSTGHIIRVSNEDDLNKITAISGSGPAYFFEIVHQLTQSALAQGFDEKTARQLAVQTFIGAADYLKHNTDITADKARDNVTSPKGTTYEALQVFKNDTGNLAELMLKGTQAAYLRAVELGKLAAVPQESIIQGRLFQPAVKGSLPSSPESNAKDQWRSHLSPSRSSE